MKSILLRVDDSIYDNVLAFLSLLPQEKSEYVTSQVLTPLGLDNSFDRKVTEKTLIKLPTTKGRLLNFIITDDDGDDQWLDASRRQFEAAYSDEDSIYDQL